MNCKSIEFILELGGDYSGVTTHLADYPCTKEDADRIREKLCMFTNPEVNSYANREWTFDDGSIITLWSAGIYAKLPWYFMAYSCGESEAIRYRRANPTPDTSHEG